MTSFFLNVCQPCLPSHPHSRPGHRYADASQTPHAHGRWTSLFVPESAVDHTTQKNILEGNCFNTISAKAKNLLSRKEESKNQHFRISADIKDKKYTHQLLAFCVSETLCQIQRSLSCIISCKKNKKKVYFRHDQKISSLYQKLIINDWIFFFLIQLFVCV